MSMDDQVKVKLESAMARDASSVRRHGVEDDGFITSGVDGFDGPARDPYVSTCNISKFNTSKAPAPTIPSVHGQLDRVMATAVALCQRTVAIESALCGTAGLPGRTRDPNLSPEAHGAVSKLSNETYDIECCLDDIGHSLSRLEEISGIT